MADNSTDVEVTLKMHHVRCAECRRFFIVEDRALWRCAGCAHDQIDKLQRERDGLLKTIQGLRAAVTRLAKGRKK